MHSKSGYSAIPLSEGFAPSAPAVPRLASYRSVVILFLLLLSGLAGLVAFRAANDGNDSVPLLGRSKRGAALLGEGGEDLKEVGGA